MPVVTHQGVKVFYGIVFSLDRVKGLPVDLHMRVETAYPCDEKDIVTYGSVRFVHSWSRYACRVGIRNVSWINTESDRG